VIASRKTEETKSKALRQNSGEYFWRIFLANNKNVCSAC
jgi:hypothetical protein